RLARAGFADNCQHFARPQLEGNVTAADPVAVEPGQAACPQQRLAFVMWRVHAWSPEGAVRSRTAGSAAIGPTCPLLRRVSQWSLSEQTNIRWPRSSSTTSSR